MRVQTHAAVGASVNRWTLLATGIILALPAFIHDPYFRGVLVLTGIYGLLALSLDLLFGVAGQISFGHAALFGLGAYASTLMVTGLGISYWIAAPLALALVGLFGFAIGLLSMRLHGVFFAIATLAVAEILRLINLNWVDFTRGAYGLAVPRPFIPFTSVQMVDKLYYYYFAWGSVLAVVALLKALQGTPLGRAMRAVAQSEPLAASIAISPLRTKISAFVLSSIIAALAGVIYAPYYGIISPELMGTHYSAIGLLMVVVGGKGTLYGALLGAAIFTVVPELFRAADDLQMVFFASALVLSVLFLPGGLWRVIAKVKFGTLRPSARIHRSFSG